MAEEPTVTDVICFKDFLDQWKRELAMKEIHSLTTGEKCFTVHCKEYSADSMKQSFEEFAAEYMPLDVVTELDAECSPATLTCDHEPHDAQSIVAEIPADVDLSCIQSQKIELERRQHSSVYRSKALDKMKYRTRDGPWKHCMLQPGHQYCNQTEDEQANNVKAVYPDILVTVQIYRPFTKRKNLYLEQEFNVLGQQKLTELRDKILCISDHLTVGDFSENPDTLCETVTKDLFKSGFFYIEGVCYNDMRDPSNKDYSRHILDWAKDSSRGVGPFCGRRMEETCFVDVSARLGQPYCYIHQGDCEHILIFTDIRMLHPEDCHLLNFYPILICKSRERRPKCRICKMYLAKWVTWGSQLAPEDPCFFCETCFRALHYDGNGKKIVSVMSVFPVQDIRQLKK